jgi:hypothetical protein
MTDSDNKLVQATDALIGLYRSIDRATLDLPVISLMPFLKNIVAIIKFGFLLLFGIILIIPVNFVILLRNIFPGHWRYRPFFLKQIYYCVVWLWRGEVPTFPFVFVRPLLTAYMKGHFERRLRRLRLELLDSEVSDVNRSAVLGRIDVALERWKAPRIATIVYTIVVPAIISLPTWYKQFTEFLSSLEIQLPTHLVVKFITDNLPTDSLFWVGVAATYLLAIPITSFLAKRGLFVGNKPDRICFPGDEAGPGVYYSKEREILSSVGLRVREAPIDFWLLGIVWLIGLLMLPLLWGHMEANLRSQLENLHLEKEMVDRQIRLQIITQVVVQVLSLCAFSIALFRRRRTDRW